MKKYLAVLFIVFSFVVMGCGKGATGFDKPDDLAAKVVSLRNTVEKGDVDAMIDITYFSKSEDKKKVKEFFAATVEITKKMMEMAKQFAPDAKFAFKDSQIDGDKGKLLFTDGSKMEIVKINGKWFLSSEIEMFKGALTKTIEEYKKEWEQKFNEMKEGMEGMPKMTEEDRKKMEEGMKMAEEMKDKMPK